MYETKVFESGDYKVVCDSVVVYKSVLIRGTYQNCGTFQNRVSFYENETLVMLATLHEVEYIIPSTSAFRKLYMYRKIQKFLVEGLAAFPFIEQINEGDLGFKVYWGYEVFLNNEIKYACCNFGTYPVTGFTFKIKDDFYTAEKVHYSKLNYMTFAEINKLHKEDIYSEFTDINRQDKSVYKCNGFIFDTQSTTYSQVMKKENLMKCDFFNTGKIFKFRDDDIKKLAKQKLLTGKKPFLLAVDSEGYAIFDGI